jgi:hypothetical protein
MLTNGTTLIGSLHLLLMSDDKISTKNIQVAVVYKYVHYITLLLLSSCGIKMAITIPFRYCPLRRQIWDGQFNAIFLFLNLEAIWIG